MDVSRFFSLFLRVYTGLLVDGEELSFAFTFGAFPRVWLIIYCKNQIKVGFLFLMNGLLRKYVHTQRRPFIVH